MEYRNDNNKLTIFLSGRISNDNSAKTEQEVMEICDSNSFDRLVLDAEKLIYISSAGLRVIMKLMRKYSNISVIGTSAEVYDVFSVTGFTEMINVEKAYRTMSVDGCDIIGTGAYGTVYRVSEDTIVKVFSENVSLEKIKTERELAKRAFVLGVPTAIPYDIVKVGDSYGTVFELLNARTAANIIIESPESLHRIIEKSVELLKLIGSIKVKEGELPQKRDVTINFVKWFADKLSSDVSEKLLGLLSSMPVSFTMLHGDCHIKNILVQGDDMLIIDMDSLAAGDPIFELGALYTTYLAFSETNEDDSMKFLGIPHETAIEIWETTLKLYLGDRYDSLIEKTRLKTQLIGSINVIATLHIINRDDPELRSVCMKHICDITPVLDTLALYE